jgi:hypothetical protein
LATSSILPDQARQHRTKIIDGAEPPKCPYNNSYRATRHPDGLNRRTCPACLTRSRWVAADRRERVKTGQHIPERRSRRSSHYNPELRKPVPKCRLYHPSIADKRACPRCIARKRYTTALWSDARRDGNKLIGLVDVAETRRHITEVLVPSGLSQVRIAQLAGVDQAVVSLAAHGTRTKIYAINAAAILSVQPLAYRLHGRGTTINDTGTRRKMRGLYAQGWMAGYMAELAGTSMTGIWHWIAGRTDGRRSSESVQPEVAEAAQRLVDKLGPFDIAELDEPMDGMSQLSADRAAKRGWVVLADWDGLDIDDPRVTPHRPDETLAASNGLVLVDVSKVERALDFQPVEDDDGFLTTDRFACGLTKMELYEIVRVGSERDHAGVVRFSANLLAQRLDVSERKVQRCRDEMARANGVLDAALPLAAAALAAGLILATGEWSAGLRLRTALDLLHPYPIRRGFYRDLVILGATQPRPYGRGWDDVRLAGWLGCTVQDAAALRGRAARAARRDYKPSGGNT